MIDIAIHAVAAVIAWTTICRAVKMSHETALAVRLAMAAQGTSAFFLAFVSPVSDALMHWCLLAFAASVLAVQFVTARYWSRGTPEQFRRRAP